METEGQVSDGDIGAEQFIRESQASFIYFLEFVFPYSFKNYIEAEHFYDWAIRIANNSRTATISARKHGKSTLMYSYLIWRIFRMADLEESEDWIYMSYTEPLSRYHTSNIKKLIRYNPFFNKIFNAYLTVLSGSSELLIISF